MITESNKPPVVIAEAEKLTPMIRRAANALAQANTIPDIRDAKREASAVYDAVEVIERHMKAAGAQVEVITACHHTMGEALKIEAAAMCRIADEYDAAQARGELKGPGQPRKRIIPNENNTQSVTDVGLTSKLVLEARTIRDAEKAEPQIVSKTIDAKLKAGEAPQRTDVKRAAKTVLDKLAAARAPKQPAPQWQPPATTVRPPVAPTTPSNGMFATLAAAEGSYHMLMHNYEVVIAERNALAAKLVEAYEKEEHDDDEYDDEDDNRVQRLVDAEVRAEQYYDAVEKRIDADFKRGREYTREETDDDVLLSFKAHTAYLEARAARLNADYAALCNMVSDTEQQKKLWATQLVMLEDHIKKLEAAIEEAEAIIDEED